MRSILSELDEPQRRRVPTRGTARVLALSLAMVVGLLAVGGLGFAMTSVGNLIVKVSSKASVIEKTSVRTVSFNAANDQYGTTSTTTETVTSSSTTTTTQTTTTNPSTGETVVVGDPNKAGNADATKPGTTAPVAVVWPAGTFPKAVDVNVNPSPPLTGTSLVGSTNQVVSVVITDAQTGAVIHQLNQPLDILFPTAPKGTIPSVSTDGVTFRALTQITGPPLPDTMQDAYYVDSKGTHVLTRHVTLFAVLAPANISTSESGRKTQAPGSGKFGDPTRIHVGPPTVQFVGKPTISGHNIVFRFYADEQVALYFHVLSGGKEQRIVVSKSRFGSTKLSGVNRKTLHLVMLRPRQVSVTLRINGATPDAVQLTAVDYDGHSVTVSTKG